MKLVSRSTRRMELRWLRACVMGLVVILPFVGSPLSAAVFRVDVVAGSDSGSCGSSASPCESIQQAVNLAGSGDVILVSEGTYTDNVSCAGEPAVVCIFQKDVSILGGFSAGDWSVPNPSVNVTIIDGQDTRRGVLVKRGGSSAGFPDTGLRLEGFTVQNGRATGDPLGFGGGLRSNFGDLVLRDVIFQDNVATGGTNGLAGGGGAALLANSDRVVSATLERVVFRNNQVTGGGGSVGAAGLGGGLSIDHAVVDAQTLVFENNSVTGGGSATDGKDALGGAASLSFGTTGTLRDLVVTGNVATGASASSDAGGAFGGGIFLEGGESPVEDVTDVTILDSRFSGNLAQGGSATTAGGGVGGGLNAFASRVTLERSTFLNNEAVGGTGASTQGNAGGAGVFLEWPFSSTPPLHVLRNLVVGDNVMEGSQGGGAGIRLLAARALVSHCTVVDNRIIGAGFGLGILAGPRLGRPSELTLEHSIIADHTVPSNFRTVHIQANASGSSTGIFTQPSLFVGNIRNSNEGENNSGTFVDFPGNNLFDSNPSDFFVDPTTSDYHVDGTQPPTDAATGSTESFDLDGAPRSGDRDLGADEFGSAAFALTVAKVGAGSGTVTSSPAGIDCGGDCFENYAANTNVTLSPNPDSGFFFVGWTGNADCNDASVLMNSDKECTAQFGTEPPACTVEQDNLVLTGQTVNSTVTEQACNSITAGPSYTVGSPGDVTFHAPTIVLRDGFVVQGSFTAINGVP